MIIHMDMDVNISIPCDCGTTLVLIPTFKAYSGGATCDECRKSIPAFGFVYYCPKKRSAFHPGGFDLCWECGDKLLQIQREATEGQVELTEGVDSGDGNGTVGGGGVHTGGTNTIATTTGIGAAAALGDVTTAGYMKKVLAI